jgi:hypothetical protein
MQKKSAVKNFSQSTIEITKEREFRGYGTNE